MLLITIILSSLLSFAETYTLLRFEPPRNNLAVIATLDAQKYSPGNEFVVETPQGACFLVVEKVVTDYIYVNTEQCQREYVPLCAGRGHSPDGRAADRRTARRGVRGRPLSLPK